jgi:hypothetical protein
MSGRAPYELIVCPRLIGEIRDVLDRPLLRKRISAEDASVFLEETISMLSNQVGQAVGIENPKDFPGKFRNPCSPPDGRSHRVRNQKFADTYAKPYGKNVIRVSLPRAQYGAVLDAITKAPGASAFPYQGGPMINVVMPPWIIPWLNKFGPVPV